MKQEIRERIEKIRKGEVPEGYRKTKVGIIPKEWGVTNFKKFISGKGQYGVNAPSVKYSKELPTYIRITDIDDNGRLTNKNLTSVDINDFKEYVLMTDDLLFVRTGSTTGKTYLHIKEDGKLVFAGFLIRFRIEKNIASSKFIKQFTESDKYWHWVEMMSARSGQPGINAQEYEKLPLPDICQPEQQKIAEILSTWETAIELKEKLIKEKKEFKRGLMQKLLTGGTRFPEFTDEWEEKKIIDILKFEQPNKYITNNIVDLDETLTPVLTANKSFVLGSTFDKNGIYKETPVIIFDDFTIDNKYVDFPFKIKSSAIKILKTKKDNIDIKFVYELMKFVKFPLGGHKRYYISEYQFVKIKMPKHIEQLRIVGVSNDLDSELKILNKELSQLKEQKIGLKQLLLTGIVRVKVD